MAEVDYEDIELHERLRAARAVIAQQKAEIERLRAAGDALAKSLAEFHDPFDELRLLAWQEARRG